MTAEEILDRHIAELKKSTGLEAEILGDDDRYNVVIKSVPVPPERFSKDSTDMLFKTDKQYPLSAMDMFWADEDLIRADGQAPQNADQVEMLAGRQWRRFSWHSPSQWDTAGNPLMDHYVFSESRFLEEPKNYKETKNE